MKRETLERYQVFIYLAAIAFGLLIGTVLPDRVGVLELVLWPLLGGGDTQRAITFSPLSLLLQILLLPFYMQISLRRELLAPKNPVDVRGHLAGKAKVLDATDALESKNRNVHF